jgi:hypothetical protein
MVAHSLQPIRDVKIPDTLDLEVVRRWDRNQTPVEISTFNTGLAVRLHSPTTI